MKFSDETTSYPYSCHPNGQRRQIQCHLFNLRKHHSHEYIRGDVRVICPGRHEDGIGQYLSVKPSRMHKRILSHPDEPPTHR